MTSLARSPAAFPFLTRLPLELRLLIYAFAFEGCQATVWIDGAFGEYKETWEGIRRTVYSQGGQCCYEHFGGGFGLLTSSRTVYNEALAAYWEQTVLTVSRNVLPMIASCELRTVCARLPSEIKANLRRLRNIKLPVTRATRPAEGDPDWTPTLLVEFPKLKSCSFFGGRQLAGGFKGMYLLRAPDSQRMSRHYDEVGEFLIRSGESPAAFIERRIGVSQNSGVAILSKASGQLPVVRPPGYKPRVSPIPRHVFRVE